MRATGPPGPVERGKTHSLYSCGGSSFGVDVTFYRVQRPRLLIELRRLRYVISYDANYSV